MSSGGCPGVSFMIKVINVTERFAKTVTNNLPLLSVLAFRANFKSVMVTNSIGNSESNDSILSF